MANESAEKPDENTDYEALSHARRQAVMLVKTAKCDGAGAPGCYFGGRPTLPADWDWPHYVFDPEGISVPMHFLCQIDLEQFPATSAGLALPQFGTLFFFYDTIFAPIVGMGATAGRVIYVPEDTSALDPRESPPMPVLASVSELAAASMSFWYRDFPTTEYKRWNMLFGFFDSIDRFHKPDWQFHENALDHAIQVRESMERRTQRKRSKGGLPGWSSHFALHHMGGAQYKAPNAGMLPLLVLESDGDLGFQHSDMGGIVFWISPKDLKNQAFENTVILEGST